MPNPNPKQARAARKEYRYRRLEPACKALEEVIETMAAEVRRVAELGTPPDVAELTKLAHAISQASTSLAKVLEAGELQAQVEELAGEFEQYREDTARHRVEA